MEYQLTDEEKEALKIEKKVKVRRIISYILGVFALIAIVTFIIFAMGTKKNIDTKTAMDAQELRSKLKQIINLENQYYSEHGTYAPITFMIMSKELPQYNPNLDGMFKYKFDVKTGVATGMEKDERSDVNGDNDTTDGLTLSVKWEAGVTDGSNFFWTDEDLNEFKQKAAEKPGASTAPAQSSSGGATK